MGGGKNMDLQELAPEVTPVQLGYAMPAEWEPHEATWIAWPHNQGDWPGKFAPVPWVFAEIVRHLAPGERVHVLVPPSKGDRFVKAVREILSKADVNLAHVTFHQLSTDRVWIRDSGPIFLTKQSTNYKSQITNYKSKITNYKSQIENYKSKIENRKSKIENPPPLALVDFKFNAWAKYDDAARDDALPQAVAGMLRVPRFTAYGGNNLGELQRFVLEGGSIDVNGKGCLLTTEECLLSKVQQRNPGFSRARIAQTLCDYLGVRQVLWLAGGIAGDDTHGHVDDVARFVNPATIVACVEADRRDANYGPLRQNLERLAKMRDQRGRPFNIVELPLPEPVYFAGRRLPASYANFYIANTGVLVPVFNDPRDQVALKVLEQCFQDRPIIPVYCRDLVLGLGTLHCLTQQQPAVAGR